MDYDFHATVPLRFIHNAAELAAYVVLGKTPESLYLEFKEEVDRWQAPTADARKTAQFEFCRDVTQFANTDGGCLMIGVAEASSADGMKLASAFKPVKKPDELRQWMEEAISNICVPSTFTREIEVIVGPAGQVVAVNVPPHLHTVYLWDRRDRGKTMEVVARTNHGKKHLNPDELERHIMNGSRANRLAFDAAFEVLGGKLPAPVGLVGGVVRFDGESVQVTSIAMSARSDATFTLQIKTAGGRVGSDSISVPYELVRAVWVEDTRLQLMLHTRMVLGRNQKVELGFGP